MKHLLHLDTSLRTEGSRSRALSGYYADAWRAAYPDGVVTYRDLAADPVPHLSLETMSANFTDPADRTPAQQAARSVTESLAGELLAADALVIGLPLYNYSVPSTFKSWLDRVVVPGLTAGGELAGTSVVIVTARGGGYGPGTPKEGWDHREPWLRHALAHLGIDDVTFVDTELTLARESPAMAAFDLGGAEDASYAAAQAAVDALFQRVPTAR
jgi:FMN-dependent NADH-azoreductase